LDPLLNPVWSDEFDGPEGAAPDKSKWRLLEGGDGWGNDELQHYTGRSKNVRLDGNGNLAIEAHRERFGERAFTSARITTAGLFARKWGRFEARIRLPAGRGFWPAFWMLGDAAETLGWPECGEIDIMEYVGKEPREVYGTIHGPGYSGSDSLGATLRSRDGRDFAEDFHVFGVDWRPEGIRWIVDGEEYAALSPGDLGGRAWVFDAPFSIILNLAVGGRWPGPPDAGTPFPNRLLVDWVRVYS
jgi:beta-glucanase (GH16 family)